MRLLTLCLLVCAVSALGAGTLYAQDFVVILEGAQEVPAVPTTAVGSGTLTLDGAKMLSFDITFSGLSAAETASHIHGPAPAGVNAGVQFALPVGDPKQGSVGPLTAQQESDLKDGLYYVNIHTTAFPGGEIRGQILLQSVPVEPASWGRIKQLMLEN